MALIDRALEKFDLLYEGSRAWEPASARAGEGMKTILLIDDDAVVRTVLAKYLDKNHWQVWQAEDGEKGLELARKYQPAAVICDLLLPRINGFEVCSAISRDPALQATRVIAMSSKAYPKDRSSALNAGAEEFLLKPISPPALLSLLGRLVGEPERTGETILRRGVKTPVALKFWGVRGSIPMPGPSTVFYGGNTPCIEVRAKGQIIVLDSGTGIRGLGAELVSEFAQQSLEVTILLTHTHWDHIQGFPFFGPLYNSNTRVRVLGYEGAREGLAKIISSQMEQPHFPVSLNELPGNITIEELRDMEFNIGELKVRAAFANHPGICLGYRLETEPGPIVYLPDNEPYLRQTENDDEAAGESTLEYVRAEDKKMVDFLRGAEVLILDAQYDREEYKSHQGWGHGCVEDAVSLALRAQARRLYLFHHDPDHNDDKITQMVEMARKLVSNQNGKLIIEAAREGERIELLQG